MNNLLDISFANEYSDIVGYTQKELEEYFADWIDDTASSLNEKPSEILSRLKNIMTDFPLMEKQGYIIHSLYCAIFD